MDPLASNLGHTFGHALEKLSNYKIGHGDAISAGILMALKFGEEKNITVKGTFNFVVELMDTLKLNKCYNPEWTVEKIISLMSRDKKSSSKHINLVLLEKVAFPYKNDNNPFFPSNSNELQKFLANYYTEYSHFGKSNISSLLKKNIY